MAIVVSSMVGGQRHGSLITRRVARAVVAAMVAAVIELLSGHHAIAARVMGEPFARLTPNTFIERTASGVLRAPSTAAHVER